MSRVNDKDNHGAGKGLHFIAFIEKVLDVIRCGGLIKLTPLLDDNDPRDKFTVVR